MRQPKSCRSTRMTSHVSIIASVGLRTSPYRLKTGMPCTGSLKFGDSTMLSCLSPRRPCCGPKAAAILTSPHAASASSECVRSAVTEAGCASKCNAPAGKRRAQRGFGDKSVDAKFHGCYGSGQFKRKAIGMMEVRLAGRMRQRPIGFTAVCFFDHRRKTEMPRATTISPIELQRGLQCVTSRHSIAPRSEAR